MQKKHNYLFTSESVAEGHPDKICDQISDCLVDHFLAIDSESRLAIEVLATTNKVIVAGEVRVPAGVMIAETIDQKVRQLVQQIDSGEGFQHDKLDIEILLHEQSSDIALGVDENIDTGKDEGAGDQGIMFGYAVNETAAQMPAPIFYAHRILQNIMLAVKNGELPRLGPDAKSQLTLEYEDGKPIAARSILVSIQHPEGYSPLMIKDLIKPYIDVSLPDGWVNSQTELLVNPTGRFVIGGPDGDCGLTGRKIIVDSYGGSAPHGGGAFSGKDPSKVDRSAAYMARFLAKNIVASGIANRSTIQLSYAIGLSRPLSFYINNHNSSVVSEDEVVKFLMQEVDLTPRGIRKYLALNRPIYQSTATYGHFGREPLDDGSFSWERVDDLAIKLRRRFGV